jgi:predicted ArsR family transcriptional regulator
MGESVALQQDGVERHLQLESEGSARVVWPRAGAGRPSA